MKAIDLIESMLGHVIEGIGFEKGVLSISLEKGLTYQFEFDEDGIEISAAGDLHN